MECSKETSLAGLEQAWEMAIHHHRDGQYTRAIDGMVPVLQMMQSSVGQEQRKLEAVRDMVMMFVDFGADLTKAENLLAWYEEAEGELQPSEQCIVKLHLRLLRAELELQYRNFENVEAKVGILLPILQGLLGPEHRLALRCQMVCAEAYYWRKGEGDLQAAETCLDELSRVFRQKFGPEDQDSLRCYYLLVLVSLNVRDESDHLRKVEEIDALQSKTLGPKHPDRLRTILCLAQLYAIQEQHEKAHEVLEHAIASSTENFGEKDGFTLNCRYHHVLFVDMPRGNNEQTVVSLEKLKKLMTADDFKHTEVKKNVEQSLWELRKEFYFELLDWSGGAFSSDDCPVCLKAMSGPKPICILPCCSFTSHSSCAKDWFSVSWKCPHCRRDQLADLVEN